MDVRVKKIWSKRYVYLVEYESKNGRSRQESLVYLGPFVKIAAGVPDEIRKKVVRKIGFVDWNKVNSDIRKVPIRLEELQDMRRIQLPLVLRIRQSFPRAGGGIMPRAQGELAALAIIAKKRFNEMFESVGERTYRMRIR